MEYIHREISKVIKEALDDFPVVVLTGMRQAGKSTLLLNENFLKNRRYTNFDSFTSLIEARDNPEAFLNSAEQLTIDEAQRFPELFIEIKRQVDSSRKAGRFLLSGSANFLLMEKISESLAGRAIYLNLWPMARREYPGNSKGSPFISKAVTGDTCKPSRSEADTLKPEEILTGGLPAIATGEIVNRNLYFEGYEQTYVEKDIRNLANIGDLLSFQRFLHLAANRTAQIINISGLAVDAEINAATAKRFISLLETSYIIKLVPPYLGNRASRLIKSPKLFFTDSGLAAHIIGLQDLDRENIKGKLFETYVAQNLLSIIDSHLRGARLCFWQVQGRHEVDFIIEHPKRTVAIEIKAKERWSEKDLLGLRTFMSSTPSCDRGLLAYNGKETAVLSDGIIVVPLSVLLS